MKSKLITALIIVNAALLTGLALRMLHGGVAQAQARRPADYLLIPGTVNGGSSEVVYVIDSTNGLLGAVTYNDAAKQLQSMQPTSVAQFFDNAAGSGAAGGGGTVVPAHKP